MYPLAMMLPRDGGRDQPMVAFAVGFLLRFRTFLNPMTP
jgi:hypothetical protein